MIKGFERHTAVLTDKEAQLVPGFVRALKLRTCKENAVTSTEIIQAFKKRDVKLTGARVRKIINYIRNNHLLPGLIATSNGYYVTNDPDELRDYIESLEGRLSSIIGILQATKKRYKEVITQDQRTITYG